MNPYHAIGLRIAEEREKHNLTQKELATQLNISYQCLSGWERGTRKINLDDLCKLADIFGVTCDYLIRGIQSQNVMPHKATEFSDNTLEKLSDWKVHFPFANCFFDMLIGHSTSQLLCHYAKQAVRYHAHYLDTLHGKAVEELAFGEYPLTIVDSTDILPDDCAQLFKMKTLDIFSKLLEDIIEECAGNAQKRNS